MFAACRTSNLLCYYNSYDEKKLKVENILNCVASDVEVLHHWHRNYEFLVSLLGEDLWQCKSYQGVE